MTVIKLSWDTPLGPLINTSQLEGFGFVARAQLELFSGNFDKPGSVLLGSFTASELVGVGGLTADPYPDAGLDMGRLRHLYVSPYYRRQGVGKELVTSIVEKARRHYQSLRLRTATPDAARFYETLGFITVTKSHATHVLALR